MTIHKHRIPISRVGLAAFVCVLIALHAAPLALGAVTPFAVTLFASLAELGLVLYFIDKWLMRSSRVSSEKAANRFLVKEFPHKLWYGLPFLLGFIFTLSMLIPLPSIFRSWLSPRGTELIDLVSNKISASAQALILPVLSLDPPETALRLLQLLAACSIFIIIADYSRFKKFRIFIFRTILVSAFIFYIVSVVHSVLDAEIWGTYRHGNTPLYAPLVNPNHLARIFGLYTFLCIAGAIHSNEKLECYFFVLVAILSGSGVLLSLSRGGILALAFSAVLSLMWLALIDWKHRKQNPDIQNSIKLKSAVAGVIILAIIAAFSIAGSQISKELMTLQGQLTYVDKAELYKPFMALMSDYWRIGTAPNALSGTFFSDLPNAPNMPMLLSGKVNVPYFENSFLQTLTDHGLIKGSILLLLCVIIGYSILQNSFNDKKVALLLTGIIFVISGDLMDFALEIGAVLWLTALCLALITGMQSEKMGLKAIREQRWRFRTQISALVFTAACAMCLLYFGPLAVLDETSFLKKEIEGLDSKKREVIEIALAKHPLNAEFTIKLADTYRQQNSPLMAEYLARITGQASVIFFKK